MDSPPSAGNPSPRPGGVAFLLAQIGFHATSRFAERVGQLGVTPPDIGLLRMIATRPGRSQQSLAADLGVVPSRVVTLVDKIEEKGLVERRRNPADRRNYALYLSEAGQAVMDRMREVGSAHEEEICAALDREQREQLTALLTLIADQQGLSPGVHPGFAQSPQGRRPGV